MSSSGNPLINAYGQTDRGLMREQNEDSFLVDHNHKVFAVADGLGGLPNGSLASELAVNELSEYLKTLNGTQAVAFDSLIEKINTTVFLKGRTISEDMGIGTTLSIACFNDREVNIAHIGDSGIVLFKEDSWKQLTHDHTMAQEMIDRLRPGEQAYIPDYFSHTLTKCIGQVAQVTADIFTHPIEPNDKILIFSDGVTKTMELDEIHSRISNATDPEAFVRGIIKTANDRGGPDNVTAVAIFVE